MSSQTETKYIIMVREDTDHGKNVGIILGLSLTDLKSALTIAAASFFVSSHFANGKKDTADSVLKRPKNN